MGAGANPYIYATDAIDGWDRENINAERDRFFKPRYMDMKNVCKRYNECKKPITTRPKLKNKIKFLYNIDYTKDRLPYNDNSIDVIVSNHSLQAFGNSHALQETYRILKPGGYVDIGLDTIKENSDIREESKRFKKIMTLLPKYGFKNIKFLKNVKNNTLYEYQFDKHYLSVVRAYK